MNSYVILILSDYVYGAPLILSTYDAFLVIQLSMTEKELLPMESMRNVRYCNRYVLYVTAYIMCGFCSHGTSESSKSVKIIVYTLNSTRHTSIIVKMYNMLTS